MNICMEEVVNRFVDLEQSVKASPHLSVTMSKSLIRLYSEDLDMARFSLVAVKTRLSLNFVTLSLTDALSVKKIKNPLYQILSFVPNWESIKALLGVNSL